jgi:integrase
MNIRDKVEGDREIPLCPYVESLIKALPRRNEYVFSSVKIDKEDGSMEDHISSPNYQLNSVCDVAGVDRITLHGLRRSFKSLSEWLDLPAGVIAQIQGHKPSATIEKHYTVRPLDLLRVHHEKLEKWIIEQADVHFVVAPAGLRVVGAAG